MTTPSHSCLPPGIRLVRTLAGTTEYQLDNGLQILLNVNARTPMPIQIDLVYRVGSKHENYGETGMAHMLEHMVFKLADCDGCNVLRELKKRSLSYSASTSFDYTQYHATFACDDGYPANLAWFMGWLAGMLNQQSFLAQHRLDLEKVVVLNENEMTADDHERTLGDEVQAAMFKWHNYGNDIGGTASDLVAGTAERLAAFYLRHYRPDNASLVISGQIDDSALLQWIADHFGSIPHPAVPLPAPVTVEPQQQGEREVTLRRVGVPPLVHLAYRGPGFWHSDAAALLLLRMTLDFRLKNIPQHVLAPIAVSGRVTITMMTEASMLYAILRPISGAELPQARSVLLTLFEAAERLTQAELDAVRQALLSADDGLEQAHENIIRGVQHGDWRLGLWLKQRIRALTLAELQATADILLQPAHRTLGILLPVGQAPVTWPTAPALDLDIALANAPVEVDGVAPVPGITAVALAEGLQSCTLDNGVQAVWFAQPGHGTASAHIRLSFSEARSGEQYLLAYLLRQLVVLERFEGRVSAAAAFMRLDIKVSASAPGMLEHTLTALCRTLGRSASLTADECRHLLDSLEPYRGGAVSPYPFGHRLYHPEQREWQSAVRAADINTLQPLLQAVLSRCQVTFGVYGDIDAELLRQALQDGCGSWPAAQPFRPIVLDRPPYAVLREVIRAPGRQNAKMVASLAVPPASHADYPALKIASYLLDERLFVRIREQMGLSYSLGNRLEAEDRRALFLTWAFIANFAPKNRALVEQCFDEEMARVCRSGFSEQELRDARRYVANQRWHLAWKQQHIPIGSDAAAAEILAVGVKIDDDPRHFDRLAALTLDEVNAALRRYLDPAHMQRRFIGDFV